MATKPVDMVPIVGVSTTDLIIPLSTDASDGKAQTFSVRDEQGDELVTVNSATSAVTVAATTISLTGTTTINAAAAATATTVAAALTADRPRVSVLTQTVAFGDFTDGGGATGTLTMTGSVPAEAIILGTKVTVTTAFSGGTAVSAVLQIGDGVDVDRYMTGTPDIFTGATTPIATGVPSGAVVMEAANQPVLTVTENADYTQFAAGELVVNIYYIATV